MTYVPATLHSNNMITLSFSEDNSKEILHSETHTIIHTIVYYYITCVRTSFMHCNMTVPAGNKFS